MQHLLLLCVHAHHRFTGPAALSAVRRAFGNPPTSCVALPCCPTFNPTKDIGRPPDASFEDLSIFSEKRELLVWRWREGADPHTAPLDLQQLGSGEAVIGTEEVGTCKLERARAPLACHVPSLARRWSGCWRRGRCPGPRGTLLARTPSRMSWPGGAWLWITTR